MDWFYNFFKNKDKKKINNLLALFLAGVILMLSATTFKKPISMDLGLSNKNIKEEDISTKNSGDYEEGLELRLSNILSSIEGAGKVSVMITLSSSKETVVAEDSLSDETVTVEKDKEVKTFNESSKKIILSNNGRNEPLVLKELEPRIEGVVIVSEGGGDISVKSSLTKATEALLGVAAHKILVFKMSKITK